MKLYFNKRQDIFNLFDQTLAVSTEDIEIEIRGQSFVPWSDFLLNPRRLRGSDFLMRWSQGVWSEHRVIQAVGDTADFLAIPYGPSGTAPTDDVKAVELYFKRLEAAGLKQMKRPDILIFPKSEEGFVKQALQKIGGESELQFISEDTDIMQELIAKSIMAVECENSLWKGKQMPDYGAKLKPMRRLGKKLGLRKNAVLPTIMLKGEDVVPLQEWQNNRSKKIHIWQVFYDVAYGIALDTALEIIQEGLITATEQVYQAPGGATTKKQLYKIYYNYGYTLGKSEEEPQLTAACIVDKNGHILPYVKFEGGRLTLDSEALNILHKISHHSNI